MSAKSYVDLLREVRDRLSAESQSLSWDEWKLRLVRYTFQDERLARIASRAARPAEPGASSTSTRAADDA